MAHTKKGCETSQSSTPSACRQGCKARTGAHGVCGGRMDEWEKGCTSRHDSEPRKPLACKAP
eukprot:6122268-Pleurochrysis_carterae.AAC.1